MRQSDQNRLQWEEMDLYRFFAFAFGYPSQARFTWLSQPATGPALATLWNFLGMDGKAPSLVTFENYGEYEAGYIALFDVGAPAPPIPLVESFHHRDIPPQQTVLENVDFYEVLGLRPDRSVLPPDHLVTQLEFLSSVRYLQENCADADQRQRLRTLELDFLERHLLSWIPSVQAQTEVLEPPVFRLLFDLLKRFLQSRRNSLPAKSLD